MQPLVLEMTPAPGDRLQRFVGDRVRFFLKAPGGCDAMQGWQARLRTNLGRAEVLRREILQAHTMGLPLAGASWRDLPMEEEGNGWALELPLAETGFFKAKAYLTDPRGWQHWPIGLDVGLAVHPDSYRTANTIYCAFARMFGETRSARNAHEEKRERFLAELDQNGYTVIPPSGKLRDLTRLLPHIIERLGCRILHLLPLNPTPTTYARFGRFGSPYAALDLTAIDPALVVFDRRTTGVDQFRELTYETHLLGARLFLDIAINHAGWGSALQEHHPEWFLRNPDSTFANPGAWGVTWEDLVELNHQNVALWDELAEMFLIWCRRGVDGFRCDAGYKVPMPAWQFIIARVQQEYPHAIFLLEGLGGAWETTEALLTEGGMQWAYSELFQNISPQQVASYLDYSHRQSRRVGLLVHYSETHDNDRLATRGREWSLLRNRLCALAGSSGGFGFACGVEWLATEKIKVHGSTGMAWDNQENLVPELGKLNSLLAEHPCFFDGAECTRLSPVDSPVYALQRVSAEAKDVVLVLVNTDVKAPHSVTIEFPLAGLEPALFVCDLEFEEVGVSRKSPLLPQKAQSREAPAAARSVVDLARWTDLLGQTPPQITRSVEGRLTCALAAGASYCLAPTIAPRGLRGDGYRRARAQAAWALTAVTRILPIERIREFDWLSVAAEVDRSPSKFLAAISKLAAVTSSGDLSPFKLCDELRRLAGQDVFPCVVTWMVPDSQRITPVPPGHWLLIRDASPFRATLNCRDSAPPQNVESIPVHGGHIACFVPRRTGADAALSVERFADKDRHVAAEIRFLAPEPSIVRRAPAPNDLVLLTNGIGGMARLCVDLGRIQSKYDCVLGANLHPAFPVDRHIFSKRIRVWVNADGFISPLDCGNLDSFDPGPPAIWNFVANAGDGRTVEIRMTVGMLAGRNTTVFRFDRPAASQATGKQLPDGADVRLTVRIDLEDRNFHCETKRNGGAEHHFSTHTHLLAGTGPVTPAGTIRASEHRREGSPAFSPKTGFTFTPVTDRQLQVFSDTGSYHPQPEWSENISHPVEQSRGQTGAGDAYSPGWFELPLAKGAQATVVVTAELSGPDPGELLPLPGIEDRGRAKRTELAALVPPPANEVQDVFVRQLLDAARAFVVRRNGGKTVIAGYPWFLDWGRDSLICARGLLAGGMLDEVEQLIVTFARFEQNGTLPNTIHGEDASNRDTSDAPLWFGIVCEEVAALVGSGFYQTTVGKGHRTIADVLRDIALNYAGGTPNGIRMDRTSGLIWSPSHFTWMDTNYPACTPREGYPVEIQSLWIRLLRQLQRIENHNERKRWDELAAQARASLDKFFWREERSCYADVLAARPGQPAAEAVVDESLRSNCLFVVSLGLAEGDHARRCMEAALRYLVVPGALRSLAPLPVAVPLPVRGADGRLLNNPIDPYWGHYEGDEDMRRKPAYHNGTAWTWMFPVFCEALVRAWDFSPEAVATAKAYLGSIQRLMAEGCIGHLPEIVDGDAPHAQRGCDAQAWGATEALRVWKLLQCPRSAEG